MLEINGCSEAKIEESEKSPGVKHRTHLWLEPLVVCH